VIVNIFFLFVSVYAWHRLVPSNNVPGEFCID